MNRGRVLNQADGAVLLPQVRYTETAWERARGLLGQPTLDPNSGLVIAPCRSVHMFFMRFPIDVVYLSKQFQVVKIVSRLQPWRVSFAFGAAVALEIAAGRAAELGLETGQTLVWDAQQ